MPEVTQLAIINSLGYSYSGILLMPLFIDKYLVYTLNKSLLRQKLKTVLCVEI